MSLSQKIAFASNPLKTEFLDGVMLGYGRPEHKMKGSYNETYVRTFICWDKKDRPLILICLEVAFITGLLYDSIDEHLEKTLKIKNYRHKSGQMIMLAQHTHTNIGGYSGELLYNVPSGGKQEHILQRIMENTLESVKLALKKEHDGFLYWMDDSIPEEETLFAYNRSIEAYVKNAEFKDLPNDSDQLKPSRAWDHRAHLWFIKNETNAMEGVCHFLPLHTNTLTYNYYYRHSDHKGITSRMLEEKKNIFALLGQGYCGDISPKSPLLVDLNALLKSKKLNEEHTLELAKKQYQYIEKSLTLAEQGSDKIRPLDFSEAKFLGKIFDMSQVEIAPEYLPFDSLTKTTTYPALGASFIVGSLLDGASGFPAWLANPLAKLSSYFLKKYHLRNEKNYFLSQYPKKIFVHSHFKYFLHPWFEKLLPLISLFDKIVKNFSALKKMKEYNDIPWSPTQHFMQLWILGDIAYFTIPFEITTVAGMRLEKSILKKLASLSIDIKRVMVLPYANNYSGYITTHEEYDAQLYEGGHNVYGRNSLAALQTLASQLCQEILTT